METKKIIQEGIKDTDPDVVILNNFVDGFNEMYKDQNPQLILISSAQAKDSNQTREQIVQMGRRKDLVVMLIRAMDKTEGMKQAIFEAFLNYMHNIAGKDLKKRILKEILLMLDKE